MYKQVFVGADSSKTALKAVKAAAELAAALGARLHIATAYKPESINLRDLPESVRESVTGHPADVLLDELRRLGDQAGVEVEVHAAPGEPAEAIVRTAKRVGADLIVVGNKGMLGAKRVLGSVPNSVAHHAECSVLIVDTTSDSA